MSMFIKKLVDHLLNQVLVEGLANSRTFQRFAVWSHKTFKELGEKSKANAGDLENQVGKVSEYWKQRRAEFQKEFQEEMRKMQQQQQNKKP